MAEREIKTKHLQWIGQHPAVKASELKPGDITVWNGGGTEKIIAVTPSKSGKTLTATIEYTGVGGKIKRSTRRFGVNTLIGIDSYSENSKPKAQPAKAKTAVHAPKPKTMSTTKAPKPAPVQKPKVKDPAKTYTVQGKTFATKAEAQAYKSLQKQRASKPLEIKESTRKPSHKLVSFPAKNK